MLIQAEDLTEMEDLDAWLATLEMSWDGDPVTIDQTPPCHDPHHSLQTETVETSGPGSGSPAAVVFDEELAAALGPSAYLDHTETNTNNTSVHPHPHLQLDFDHTLLDHLHPLSQSHHPHHIQCPPFHISPPRHTDMNNPLRLGVCSMGNPENHQPAKVPRVSDNQINKKGDRKDDPDDNNDKRQPAGARAGGTSTKSASGERTKKRREPSQVQDHIMAERKRRELLSAHFISLSAIVPGLKKTDKTSVLGEAIKYMKELKEKVKALEVVATKQRMALVKKSQVVVVDQDGGVADGNNNDNENDTFSSVEDDSTGGGSRESLPEVKVKVTSDKSVLIKMYCENWKGVLPKLFLETEKLGINLINCSVIHFGALALDITILAQMEKDVDANLKDVIRSLGATVSRPVGEP